MSSPAMGGTYFHAAAERSDDWHETVLQLAGDGIYQLDLEGRFVAVNDPILEATGYDAEELLGEHVTTVLDDESVERTERTIRALLAGDGDAAVTQTATVRSADGETFGCEFRMGLLREGGEVRGTVGVVRDLTGRWAHERRLRRERDRLRARLDEVLSRVTDAVLALDEDWRLTYLNERAEAVLDVDADEVLGESIWSVFPAAGDDEFRERFREAMARQEPVHFETYYEPADEWFEVHAYPSPTGLSAYARPVTERVERERELERQRERLATLNEFNRVVQDVSHAVVEADTRETVEQVVLQQLTTGGPFAAAWFGDVEPGEDTVRVRAEAGTEDVHDGIDVSVAVGEPADPIGRALRTGETRIVADVLDEPALEEWRGHAREHGYRSVAAIPVTFEGARYGVLVVHGEAPDTFGRGARYMVNRLGRVVGHALSAIDRKKALVGDDVIELEFRVDDVFEARGVECGDGRVAFESVLPTGDGSYVGYGSASEDGVEVLRTLAATLDHYTDLSIRAPRAGGARFVLRMRDPPFAGVTASLGGRLAAAAIEDGVLRATVHLPYDADVREAVDTASEVYPGVEVLAQRRVQRPGATVDAFQTVLDDDLTERQRVALEAAYVAGFFEWPRECTGEELADSLGVSPATYHQHLRAAERRVVAALFGAPKGDLLDE